MNIYTLNVSDELNGLINSKKYSKHFILCDTNTAARCLPLLKTAFEFKLIETKPGEAGKKLDTCKNIWQQLADGGADRQSVLVNLGGGSITDMGGFAASTFQRGMDFIHIPTTLLGMVDAAVGGKTGVNLGELKNYIGTFKLPVACICDPVFLQTLPESEWQNGKAEMIKHGALAGNQLWDLCKGVFPAIGNNEAWLAAIRSNAEYKVKITESDFLEKDIRAQLNFGHTAGHALESLALSMGTVLPHGQAVAAGMLIETLCALEMDLCDLAFYNELAEVIRQHFEVVIFQRSHIPTLIEYCGKDKKNESGNIAIVPVKKPGQPLPKMMVNPELLSESFEKYLYDSQSLS